MRKSTLRKHFTNDGGATDDFMGQLAVTLESMRDGDFTVRLPADWTGSRAKWRTGSI